jgi:hypothetical protein
MEYVQEQVTESGVQSVSDLASLFFVTLRVSA